MAILWGDIARAAFGYQIGPQWLAAAVPVDERWVFRAVMHHRRIHFHLKKHKPRSAIAREFGALCRGEGLNVSKTHTPGCGQQG